MGSPWFTSDPVYLLANYHDSIRPRQHRWIGVVFGRWAWRWMQDVRSRNAIDAAEAWLEGRITGALLREAHQDALRAMRDYARDGEPQHLAFAARIAGFASQVEFEGPLLNPRQRSACLPSRDDEPKRFLLSAIGDLVPNPERTITFDRASLDRSGGTILHLAESMYAQQSFELMPIMADALEENGCTDSEILRHCRSKTRHHNGCWVLELIRGKVEDGP